MSTPADEPRLAEAEIRAIADGADTDAADPTGTPAEQRELRGYRVKPGHLPVNEVLFDRPGAPSPFGEDVTFPLTGDRLAYVHPVADAEPSH